jgi:hypothetical protein
MRSPLWQPETWQLDSFPTRAAIGQGDRAPRRSNRDARAVLRPAVRRRALQVPLTSRHGSRAAERATRHHPKWPLPVDGSCAVGRIAFTVAGPIVEGVRPRSAPPCRAGSDTVFAVTVHGEGRRPRAATPLRDNVLR